MNPADRSLRFTLNGRALELAVPPALDLLTLLRELGCMSVKFSDEHGEGGADTVLVDDRPVSAATHLALQVEGRRVETLEGLRDTPWLAALAERFLDEGAVQCGYCTPAFLLQLEALRRRDPAPSAKSRSIAGVSQPIDSHSPNRTAGTSAPLT